MSRGALGTTPGHGRWASFVEPLPIPFWAAVAIAMTVLWFLLPGSLDNLVPGFDWTIYGAAWERWTSLGTPYQVLPPGWDPCRQFPYLYPPSSWPLMVLAGHLPYQLLVLATVPLLTTRGPAAALVPIGAALILVSLGPGLVFANVNVLLVGLLLLSFRPGIVGGLALAMAVALKGYPIVLLPFLWSDRRHLRWFTLTLVALVVSGTAIFGIQGWVEVFTTLLNEGPNCDSGFNPFAALGLWRLAPATLLVLAGWVARSPTLALAGATFASGVVTRHYLVTFVATLPYERLSSRFARDQARTAPDTRPT